MARHQPTRENLLLVHPAAQFSDLSVKSLIRRHPGVVIMAQSAHTYTHNRARGDAHTHTLLRNIAGGFQAHFNSLVSGSVKDLEAPTGLKTYFFFWVRMQTLQPAMINAAAVGVWWKPLHASALQKTIRSRTAARQRNANYHVGEGETTASVRIGWPKNGQHKERDRRQTGQLQSIHDGKESATATRWRYKLSQCTEKLSQMRLGS